MRDPRFDPDAGSHYSSEGEHKQAIRDYCDWRLAKLRKKRAKLGRKSPKTGIEMGEMDIKRANLDHEIYELELQLEALE